MGKYFNCEKLVINISYREQQLRRRRTRTAHISLLGVRYMLLKVLKTNCIFPKYIACIFLTIPSLELLNNICIMWIKYISTGFICFSDLFWFNTWKQFKGNCYFILCLLVTKIKLEEIIRIFHVYFSISLVVTHNLYNIWKSLRIPTNSTDVNEPSFTFNATNVDNIDEDVNIDEENSERDNHRTVDLVETPPPSYEECMKNYLWLV